MLYGNWPPNIDVTEEDFGTRSEHIIELKSYSYAVEALSESDDKEKFLKKLVNNNNHE
jgi:hypothetical protein